MNPRRYAVTVVSDGAGNGSGATPSFSGEIVAVHYVKDGSSAYSDGSTFTLTLEATGQGVWSESNVNASAARAPRQPTHTQLGAAVLFAAAGQPVNDRIVVADDRVLITIASAGATKTGKFIVVVE